MKKYFELFENLSVEEVTAFLADTPVNDLPVKRIAFLRNITLELIEPQLKMMGLLLGYEFKFYYSGFNQYFQEVIDETSEFYRFNPDLVVLWLNCEDLFSTEIKNNLYNESVFNQEKESVLYHLTTIIAKLRSKTNAFVLMANFIPTSNYDDGLYELQNKFSLYHLIKQINFKLVELSLQYPAVAVFDWEYFILQRGTRMIYDYRNWILAKSPFYSKSHPVIVKYLARYLQNIFGKTKKCIIVDLDNTLWGGLAGEDGLTGISLGDNYPGIVYKDLQKKLKSLINRGILLAINSKNNPDDALEIINQHPEMVLHRDDFVAIKINWNDKVSNCQDIARELNIGLDSIVFLDDDKFERELVSTSLPEVYVPEFPPNIINLPKICDGIIFFDKLNILAEDRQKGELYLAQIKRKEWENTFPKVEDFLISLNMDLFIEPIDRQTVDRIVQLSQKTNQFNLTCRRYNEMDVINIINNPQRLAYCLRLSDRFGDNGLVGFIVINTEIAHGWDIEEFVLSCRVMNRRVEFALMAAINKLASQNKINELYGNYIPTVKNKPVEKLYEQMGFELVSRANNTFRYVLKIGRYQGQHYCQIKSVKLNLDSNYSVVPSSPLSPADGRR